MSARGWEFIAPDEPTVISKPLLDTIVVENGQGDGRLPDPPWTDESNRRQVFRKANNFLDQLVASKAGPRRRGWGFSRYAI